MPSLSNGCQPGGCVQVRGPGIASGEEAAVQGEVPGALPHLSYASGGSSHHHHHHHHHHDDDQIPRYIITLHELLAHTPPDHVEKNSLEQARVQLEDLSRQMHDEVEECEYISIYLVYGME